MANTYSSLFYHLVFSTKNREDFLEVEIENRVWAYIGGIARKHNCTAIQVGGIEDHIHALILSPPKYAPSEIEFTKNFQICKNLVGKTVTERFR
jgi:putative transposase